MAKDYARQFYNSAAWKQTRRAILRRDLYTCRHCQARAEEVHHIIELTPNNISDRNIALGADNLISLCHDCHSSITKRKPDLLDGFIFDEYGQVSPRGVH